MYTQCCTFTCWLYDFGLTYYGSRYKEETIDRAKVVSFTGAI